MDGRSLLLSQLKQIVANDIKATNQGVVDSNPAGRTKKRSAFRGLEDKTSRPFFLFVPFWSVCPMLARRWARKSRIGWAAVAARGGLGGAAAQHAHWSYTKGHGMMMLIT